MSTNTKSTCLKNAEHLSQKLMFAEIDKARLQQKLDRVARMIKDKDEELYSKMSSVVMFDLGLTTENWINS